MSTTTAKKDGLFSVPTVDEALGGAKDMGLIAAGIFGAHGITSLIKKDTMLVNGGFMVAGLGAAVAIKHPMVRMIGLGFAAYGAVKLAGNIVKEVAAPGTTEGLNGILPEKAKAMLRKFIPTLSGVEDGAAGLGNTDDEFSGLSLDDFESRSESAYSGMNGTGELEENAAGLGLMERAY